MPKKKTGLNSIYEIFAIIVFTAVIFIAVIYAVKNNSQDKKIVVINPNTTNENTNSAQDQAATYYDDEYGFKFQYEQGGQQNTSVKKEDNKITVCLDEYCTQSVEIFSKDPEQTLAQAIELDFLYGYDPEECWVESISTEDSIEKSAIGFPIVENGEEPWWVNAENCPDGYTKANGIRYFYYDRNFPDRYAFFDIGQYAIIAYDSVPWQDTFEFISEE